MKMDRRTDGRTVLLHVVELNAPVCQDVVEGAQPCAVPFLRRLGSDPKHTCEELRGNESRHNQWGVGHF